MVIWRMLRRVSDCIKLDLDDRDLHQATQVREYRIKDILVKMNKAEREIVFLRDGAEKVVSVEELERNPTGVFRVLTGMVSSG